MLCLEGTGALSHVSLRHQPNIFNEPCVFAAVWVKGEPKPGARPRGPGAELEDVRPQGLRQRVRGRDLGPAPVRPRSLRGPLPVRQGDAHRRRASPEGGDHGLEPVRGGRSRQLEPALRGPRVPAREPHRARPGRGLLVERPQLHGGGEGREGGARDPRRLRSLGRRREGEAVGRRLLLREDGRRRGPGEPRLVPGRVVRRPDPRLEGRRGGRLLRAPARLRGAAFAGRQRVRAVHASRPAPRRRSWCSSRGTWGRATCGSETIRRTTSPWASAATAPGTRSATRGSRRRRSRGGRATPRCARRPPASRTASTTRRSRPRSSRRWPPTSPSSSPPPCCARRTGASGAGRAAGTAGAAATAPARTSGTTRRRCRTSSRRWSGPCARRSSASRRTPAGTRPSAPRCPSGPPSTTSTPRPTGSSAAS